MLKPVSMLTPHLQVNVAQKRRDERSHAAAILELRQVWSPVLPANSREANFQVLMECTIVRARVCSACVLQPCLLIGRISKAAAQFPALLVFPFVVFEALFPRAAGARPLPVFPW